MDMYEQLVSKGKDKYLKSLEEIKWFNYPQNSRKKIIRKIAENTENIYLDLHHFSFFSDDFYSIEDYKKLLEDILTITGLNFSSSEFNFDEKSNTLRIKIIAEEKEIEMNFDMNEFVMIPQIKAEFNGLFNKLKLDSRILWLPLESDIFFYVFIPIQLYMQAVEKGVIPKESAYFDNL